MRTNREIAELFAAQFEPPLMVCATAYIGGVQSDGALMLTSPRPEEGVGLTAFVHNGRLFAFVEMDAEDVRVAKAGEAMARAVAAMGSR